MYRPLYWYGDRDVTGVDYALSLADRPVYSDRDRVVTITLKHTHWSDGEPVDARGVIFWINLLKANRAYWASYVPGGFPDNVSSWKAVGKWVVFVFELEPLLQPDLVHRQRALADHTAADARGSRRPGRWLVPAGLSRGARQHPSRREGVAYGFLSSQAKRMSSYASSPIWSIVDGPWKPVPLSTEAWAWHDLRTCNAGYDGPSKPKLAKFGSSSRCSPVRPPSSRCCAPARQRVTAAARHRRSRSVTCRTRMLRRRRHCARRDTG